MFLLSSLIAWGSIAEKFELLEAMKNNSTQEVKKQLTFLILTPTIEDDISSIYYEYAKVYPITVEMTKLFVSYGLDVNIKKDEIPLAYILLDSTSTCSVLQVLFDAGLKKDFKFYSPYIVEDRKKTKRNTDVFVSSLYTKAVEFKHCIELFEQNELTQKEKDIALYYSVIKGDVDLVAKQLALGANAKKPFALLGTKAVSLLYDAKPYPEIQTLLLEAGAKK
jgi:hypothetical protein